MKIIISSPVLSQSEKDAMLIVFAQLQAMFPQFDFTIEDD